MRGAVILVVLCSLGGCTIVPGGTVDGHYLGYVRVVADPDRVTPDMSRSRLESVGIWVEIEPASRGLDSAGLGYRHAERLRFASDCRLAIIVENEAQLSAARALAESLEGVNACAIDATDR